MSLFRSFVFFIAFLTGTPGFTEPPNITLLKQQVEQYQQSGEYLQEVQQVISKAQQYLQNAIKQNTKKLHPAKLALVLDIDETSLSNFSKIKARDFCGNVKSIHREILAADSPAMKPTLNLYNYALQQGVKVFFVTGRSINEKQATVSNLHKAGYDHWSRIFFKPQNYTLHSIVPFKTSARKKITEMGYTIVESIGDQYSDLKGGYAQCRFKLPNPFYYLN